MKVAISLPDDLARQIDRCAKRLGVPRSRLLADGARLVVARYGVADATAAWNAVIDDVGQPDEEAALGPLRRKSKRAVHQSSGLF